MTYLEEMQSLTSRISNLEARIECAEDEDMALNEKRELIIMLNKLDQMEGENLCGTNQQSKNLKAFPAYTLQKVSL